MNQAINYFGAGFLTGLLFVVLIYALVDVWYIKNKQESIRNMLDPTQAIEPLSVSRREIIIAIIGVLIVNCLFFLMVEFYMTYEVADSTAEVVHKEISTPVNAGEKPFLLVLNRSGNIYHVRVPVEYYRELKIGDIVLVVDTQSGILNRTLKTRLFDHPIFLKQSIRTPNSLKANKDKVWSWNSASHLFFTGGHA